MTQNKAMRALALACVFAGGSAALAQTAVDGAIGGTVHDATGANIANAQVKIVNNGTAAEQNLTTDGDGFYRAIHLQPGSYTVSISGGGGLGTYASKAVVVQVGLLTNVDATLQNAGVDQVVEVTSELPSINTTSPDFANVIDLQVLGNLPVNNYRWSSYALLTPGVVANSDGFGLLSFRGQSVLQNNITIDGADNNQAFFAEERGRTRAGYSTAQSSIQEFQVNTSNYTSEYGRAVGGVVNSITKSGTNSFHGDLYYRNRDAGWGTKNPFTTITTQNAAGAFVANVFKPKDKRQQIGGSIGGPIVKDKLFFFFAYDRFKRVFPGTGVASSPAAFFATPDANLPAGKVCGGTGAAAPSTIDASACTLATNLYGSNNAANYALAANNYTSGLAGLNTMLGAVPRTGDQSIYFPKIDWQINGRNHVSAEVNRLLWASPAGIQTQATNNYGVRSFGDDFVKLTFGVAKLDTTITDHLVNEVRYQYGRDFEYEFAQQPATAYEQNNLLKSAGGTYTNPLGLPPAVSITNGFNFGTPTFLQRARYPDETRWQVADTANWNHGSHNIKFGIDYLHTNDASRNLRTQYGSYSYTNLTSYFTDFYRSQSTNPAVNGNARNYNMYQQAFGPEAFEFLTNDFAGFVQDEWKVAPRLSLTLGARYDYEQLPDTYASLRNPLLPQTNTLPSDKNNIAPRVGFALDPYGNGKTSLRGGFGMFYGRIINSTIYSALTSTGNLSFGADGVTPVSQLTYSYTSTQSGAPNFARVVASAGTAGTAPAATYFAPGFQNPASYQYDMAVQQDLGYHTNIAISYIGALGRQATNFLDQNLPTPSSTVTYRVVDASGRGPLAAGSTVTVPFFARGTAPCTTANGTTIVATSGRPNPCFGALTAVVSNVNSSYNALVGQIKHQMTHGLSLEANYTWSHGLDYGVNSTTFTATNSVTDPFNRRADYGNSDNNVPNRFVIFAVYQTPKKFHGALGYLLNSYELAPSFAAQSGLPFSAGTTGTPTTALTSAGTQSALSSGANGSGGAARLSILGRNRYEQPRTLVADFRLSKRFDFRENTNLELLIESFNLANHQNVTGVQGTAYTVATTAAAQGTLTYNVNSSTNAPVFGTRNNVNSNLAYSPRQIQVGARFHF